MKAIFQLLFKDKNDWDSPVSGDVLSIWQRFLIDLETYNNVRIKRFAFIEISDNVQSVVLHGFCDSSLQCYCGVLYLQIFTSTGVRVFFLAAKTKVAPLKELSIARLELLGCVLLIDLFNQVKFAIEKRVNIEHVKFWSDSIVALCWIKGRTKTWKPWVENRVVKIRKVIDDENWFYVEGKVNPADIPTRICEKKDFVKWFEGPSFLYEKNDESGYFDVNARMKDCDVLTESTKINRKVKENPVILSILAEIDNKNSGNDIAKQCVCMSNVIIVTRFSTLEKLLRTTSYVLRFIKNIKARIKGREGLNEECLAADEMENALNCWIITEQKLIRENDNYEKMKLSLKLYSDDNNILRLRGRFGNSDWDVNKKHPILIGSAERYFTILLIRHAHEMVMHHGVETTLNWLRSKYWIVKGRRTVKQVLNKCIICRRFQARTLSPPETPDLPAFRIDNSFSFYNIGIDFCGPLYVRSHKDCTSKVYILLVTCASSRALHLELVPDLTSVAFIRAFIRFVSRKGSPKLVISDNAKTFRSVDVKRFMVKHGIHAFFL